MICKYTPDPLRLCYIVYVYFIPDHFIKNAGILRQVIEFCYKNALFLSAHQIIINKRKTIVQKRHTVCGSCVS